MRVVTLSSLDDPNCAMRREKAPPFLTRSCGAESARVPLVKVLGTCLVQALLGDSARVHHDDLSKSFSERGTRAATVFTYVIGVRQDLELWRVSAEHEDYLDD